MGPRISSLESVGVRLAVTKTTVERRVGVDRRLRLVLVLLDQLGSFGADARSCDGVTVIESLWIATLTRVGGDGRGSLACSSAPQPSGAKRQRADARARRATASPTCHRGGI